MATAARGGAVMGRSNMDVKRVKRPSGRHGSETARSRNRSLSCQSMGIEQEWKRRAQIYEPKLALSDDKPAWNKMRLHPEDPITIHKQNGSTSVRVCIEVSRQMIAARDAYKFVGQHAQLRILTGATPPTDVPVEVSSAPFSDDINWLPLYRLRGDIPTGATRSMNRSMLTPDTEEEKAADEKARGDKVSVTGDLDLFFPSSTGHEKLLNIFTSTKAGDIIEGVELGPFSGCGLDFRRLMGTFMFRKILMFASESHIHMAKSCIEDATPHGLDLPWREENRLYYALGKESKGPTFEEEFKNWNDKFNTIVRVAQPVGSMDPLEGCFQGSVSDLFDEDDLEYCTIHLSQK